MFYFIIFSNGGILNSHLILDEFDLLSHYFSFLRVGNLIEIEICKGNTSIIVDLFDDIGNFFPFSIVRLDALLPFLDPFVGILVNLLVELFICFWIWL